MNLGVLPLLNMATHRKVVSSYPPPQRKRLIYICAVYAEPPLGSSKFVLSHHKRNEGGGKIRKRRNLPPGLTVDLYAMWLLADSWSSERVLTDVYIPSALQR